MPAPTNRKVKSGAALGSSLEFFTLTATGVNLLTDQPVLNAVIETISLKAQPVIIDIEDANTLKFAVEHAMVLIPSDLQVEVAAIIMAVRSVESTVVATKASGL